MKLSASNWIVTQCKFSSQQENNQQQEKTPQQKYNDAAPYQFDKELQDYIMTKTGDDFDQFLKIYEESKRVIVGNPSLIIPVDQYGDDGELGQGKSVADIYNYATYKEHKGPSESRHTRY